jgi:hypothetical protein
MLWRQVAGSDEIIREDAASVPHNDKTTIRTMTTPLKVKLYPRRGQLFGSSIGNVVANEYRGKGEWSVYKVKEPHDLALLPLCDLEPLYETGNSGFVCEKRSPIAPPYTFVTPPVITHSKAPRSTTSCTVCDKLIVLHGARINVSWDVLLPKGRKQQIRQYFHATCVDQESGLGLNHESNKNATPKVASTLSDIGVLSTEAEHSPSLSKSELKEACRSSVAMQIARFKEEFFLKQPNGRALCPFIPRIQILKSTSHVHHDGLSLTEFDVMVQKYSEEIEPGIVFEKVKFGEFVDPGVALRFASYHKQHSHLIVVSKQANLSFLRKKNPSRNCSRCQHSKATLHLPEFRMWLCRDCRYKSHCCQVYAMRQYGLNLNDLTPLTYSSVPNPCYGVYSRGFAPMKLYLLRHVEEICIAKHGSVLSAKLKRQQRIARRAWLAEERRRQSKSRRVTLRSHSFVL